MTDELSIEGKQYISSKRAADLSGYAQDYVGQLARKGLIDAQRIGGLWYVFMDSLLSYKAKAETYVPQPPQAVFKNESPDTLISFDGKDYVSAARAAEITGYHQDYVGQLARGGKILSRQVGNRWYVDREGILAHKEEKDDLLGAVQADSVGIKPLPPAETSYERKIDSWEPLNYETDSGALMPRLSIRENFAEAQEEVEEEVVVPVKNTPVPIRVVENRQIDRFMTKDISKKLGPKRGIISRITIFYFVITATVFGLVALLAYAHFAASSNFQGSATSTNQVDPGDKASTGIFVGMITRIGDIIEPLVSKELYFNRN